MFALKLFQNPRLLLMVLVIIVAAGLSAISSLPRQEDPEVAERFGLVKTLYPGATAQRVEKLVTEPIEDIMREIAQVKEVTSTSRTGISLVEVNLRASVLPADVARVWSRVRDALSDVESDLPVSATKPDLEIQKVTAHTLLVGLKWQSDEPPQLDILGRIAKDLEQTLRNLPGTKNTQVFGRPTEEVRVIADQYALTSAGLELSDLAQAIVAADTKAPAGQIRGRETTLLVEVPDTLNGLSAINDVPILVTSGDRLLKVGDVARVERGLKSPLDVIALVDGEPALVVGVTMESGQRTDVWANTAKRAVKNFAATQPTMIAVKVLFDQSVYTNKRFGELFSNLTLGIAIIVLVLLLMMGWRSAIIVAVALPMSMCIVATIFHIFGVPLHQISVTGLIIALGLLIDNAIIAVDEYGKRRTRGLTRAEAMRVSSKYLMMPLGASSITTALAFMPIVLLPGDIGEFVGTMGLSVVLSIFASLALSLSVVPALSGLLDNGKAITQRHGVSIPPLTRAFAFLLDRLLRHPLKSMTLAVILPISGFLVAGQLQNQFFPPAERNQFQLQLKLDPSASIEETARAVEIARGVIVGFPEITQDTWFLGENPPKVYYNTMSKSDGLMSSAGAFLDIASADVSRDVLPRLQRELTKALPQAMILTLPFEQGPPFEAPIELRIYGPSLDELRLVGEQLRLIVAESKNVTVTKAKITGGRAKVAVTPKEDVLRLTGFRLSDLTNRIGHRQAGLESGFILEDGEAVPIRVQIDRSMQSSLRALTNNKLVSDRQRSVGGTDIAGVPLSELSSLEVVPVASSITRHQGERYNEVQGYLQPFALPSETLADLQLRIAEANIKLKPEYRIEFGGEDAERQESEGSLTARMVPLVFLMIAIVVLCFNSFFRAAIVGLVAVLSFGIAFLPLFVMGYPMGFTAIMGMMGLIGLAINGAIIVMSALDDNPEARAGDSSAICRTVMESSRHIISTTLTTIGGFMPLILFGDIFWRPMASIISGGVLGSAILALIFVPVFYAWMMRNQVMAKTLINDLAPSRTVEKV